MHPSPQPPVDPMADTMRFDALSDTQPMRLPSFDPSAAQWFEAGEASAEAEWVDLADRRRARCAAARFTVAVAGCVAAALFLSAAH